MALLQLQTPAQAVQWLQERVSGTLRGDSRCVKPGDAFVAWPGLEQDRRAFVEDALARGAAACLVEAHNVQTWSFAQGAASTGKNIACCANLQQMVGEIAALWFKEPGNELSVLAITGTNGKTSTAWWLAEMLGVARIPCGCIGTLGAGPPPQLQHTGLTTPDAIMLQELLRTFADQGLRACALEASSIGLAQGRLNGMPVRVGIFTNFTQDHLDFHGDMQTYWQAKQSLFSWPGLQAAVVNVDDMRGASLAKTLNQDAVRQLDVWTVSKKIDARLCARNIRYGAKGLCFDVCEGGQQQQLDAPFLLGKYNVSNMLCALAAARALGVPFADAVAASAQCSQVPGRMQSSGGGNGEPLVVVDFAHTADALDNVLQVLREQAQARGGKLWCVFGCGGDRDAGKRPVMGAIADKNADVVVVTSDNPRSEKPQSIISQILLGMEGDGGHVHVEVDRARAIEQAVMQAAEADVILVAGKGHEAYQETGGQRLPFSDEQQVRAALALRVQQKQKGGAA